MRFFRRSLNSLGCLVVAFFLVLAGCGDKDDSKKITLKLKNDYSDVVGVDLRIGVDLYDRRDGTGEVYWGNEGYSQVVIHRDGRVTDVDDPAEEYRVEYRYDEKTEKLLPPLREDHYISDR